jgi:hypothetical protein
LVIEPQGNWVLAPCVNLKLWRRFADKFAYAK